MAQRIIKLVLFWSVFLGVSVVLPASVGAMPSSAGGETIRVSVARDGGQAPTDSNIFFESAHRGEDDYNARFMSDDGRLVVFATASPLTSDDTNTFIDVYLRDLENGTITRLSRTYDGAENNGDSGKYGVTISGNGNIIAFASSASNLVSYDPSGNSPDIFLFDRSSSTLSIITAPGVIGEASNPKLSEDGRYLVYDRKQGPLFYEPRFYDRVTGENVAACPPYKDEDLNCFDLSISRDGQFLVYTRGGSWNDVVIYHRLSQTEEIIRAADGSPSRKRSGHPEMSPDNRYVVFDSYSTDLAPDDIDRYNFAGNYRLDILLYDRTTQSTIELATSATGEQGDGTSYHPVFSADGRKVAFISEAWNLVSGDLNDNCNADTRVPGHTIRGHGFIANCADVFVKDLVTQEVVMVSGGIEGQLADAPAFSVSLSADGSRVAFISAATNLVAGDTNIGCPYFNISVTYNCKDVFVRDIIEGDPATPLASDIHRMDFPPAEILSLSPEGDPANSVSYMTRGGMTADGRYVVFDSFAGNIVSDDSNNHRDVFLHDRVARTTTRISVRPDGMQLNDDSYNPAITPDGHYIVFTSNAMVLPGRDYRADAAYYRVDRYTGHTVLVTDEAPQSYPYAYGTSDEYLPIPPAISADGRYLSFSSSKALVPTDTNDATDVYVVDIETGLLSLISVNNEGQVGDENSLISAISADGRFVAFYSVAGNLDPEDTNQRVDVYVHDRDTRHTERLSTASIDVDFPEEAQLAMSADGRYVSWVTRNGGTQIGDNNMCSYPGSPPTYPPYQLNCLDVYVRDRVTGELIRATLSEEGNQFQEVEAMGVITPDGQSVIFEARTSASSGPAALYRKSLTTGELYSLGISATMPRVSFSPEGGTVVYDRTYPGTDFSTQNIYADTFMPLPPGWSQTFLPTVQERGR